MKLSIIIPAYNEAKTIRRIVEKIFNVNFPIDYEIVIVDDYSRDRTYRIAKILNNGPLGDRIRLLRNHENRGKGYSLRRGFEAATGDVFVVQDADYEYDPNEIPSLLEPVLEGKTSVVFGSRFLKKFVPSGMALPNWVANRFLTLLTNVLYGSKLTDMETCYKVITKEALSDIRLTTERFDFEPEITTQLIKRKHNIIERPISYYGRSESEGKKIKARDFFIAIRVLFKNLKKDTV